MPDKDSLAESIGIGNSQNAQKNGHGNECVGIVDNQIAEIDAPRIEEYDFNVEYQKQHRHNVVLHGEHRSPASDRDHTAFIGDIGRSTVLGPLPGKNACNKDKTRKPEGSHHLD